MKTLLTFILCLIGLSALCQGNSILRNRYTTNADSATVHGDHLDALKADKLATGIADPARLGSGTANAGTALFGDSSWKIISASGNLVAEGTNGITAVTNGQLVTISFNGLNVVLSNASFQGPFTGVGAAAGKVVLNSGSGTGGYFDYSGATASNHLVAMVDGRFVDGGSTNAGGSQVWTNYGGFIFPAGEPAPDTNSVLAGPSMFFTPHGSLILGTNAVLWGQPVDDPNIAIMVNHYVTNGDPSTLNIIFNETLDTNGTFYSFVELQMQADKDHPSSQLSMDVVATNGLEFQTYVQATDGQPHFLAQTNSTDVFSVSANGLVTANGFTDNSGTPGSLVAYQGSNRQGATNGVAWQSFNNAFTASNYFSVNVTTSTNQNQIKPDFSVAEQLITTNAAFTFLAPVGVDTTLTTAQWTLVHVTNTTASAVLITSPANCHTVGTAYVTNLTDVWFNCYASKFTNAFYVPVF